MLKNSVIIGSSGALGHAFTTQTTLLNSDAVVHGITSKEQHDEIQNVVRRTIDYRSKSAIESAALLILRDGPLGLIMVATDILHEGDLLLETSLKSLSAEKIQYLFAVNTISPIMIAQYFFPILDNENNSLFAALSIRAESISDNQFGGWYSYRASKEALNMIIENLAIEVRRRIKKVIIVGLYLGAEHSQLTKPYQKKVSKDQLYSADYSAWSLLNIIFNSTTKNRSNLFVWDGEEITP